VPEFVDPVFVKTSLQRSFVFSHKKRAFRACFAITGPMNSCKGRGAMGAQTTLTELSCEKTFAQD
jgi:hypothetical protein